MSSSSLLCYGEGTCNRTSYKDLDISYLRLTPTPGENYRCPVSTPANCLVLQDNIRRSKTLQEIILQHPTSVDRVQRSGSESRSRCSTKSWSPNMCSFFEISFAEKNAVMKETHKSHWLRSLCAQPVPEILNKYRRNSDFIQTQKMWLQTFTTPGEKSLLSVWENNNVKSPCQKTLLHRFDDASTKLGGESRLGEESKLEMRINQSKPHFDFESQVTGVSRNAKSGGHKVSSPNVRKRQELNALLQNGFCLSRKVFCTLQNEWVRKDPRSYSSSERSKLQVSGQRNVEK